MRIKVGQYHFGMHRGLWAIWQLEYDTPKGSGSKFVKHVQTYEEAVKEVYQLNGWGTPKKIYRKY